MKSIQILVVGVGQWIDKYELQTLASDQYVHNIIYAPYPEGIILDHLDEMTNKICNGITQTVH